MEVCAIDLETFWADDHKVDGFSSPMEYAMHERTQIISASFVWSNGDEEVAFGEQPVRDRIEGWRGRFADAIAVGHNMSEFDAIFLRWRLNLDPRMWACTLAMARPHHARDPGLSLAALARLYGLGAKDSSALVETKGRRLEEFSPEEVERMRAYNLQDSRLCLALFDALKGRTRADEMVLMDMTVRALVDSPLRPNLPLLDWLHAEEAKRTEGILDDLAETLQVDRSRIGAHLTSDPKFKALLESMGVEVPTKTSPTTGHPVTAFAKDDVGFKALLADPDPRVRAVCEARMGLNSSFVQTRARRIVKLAAATGPRNRVPIAMRYWGADVTGRWSGFGGNPQNLPRMTGDLSDNLRRSLEAPQGFAVVSIDLSGIQMRINHFLWNQEDTVALFTADPAGADPYRQFASRFYVTPLEAVTDAQRQMGKAAELSLGFQSGPRAMRESARRVGNQSITLGEASAIVEGWRAQRGRIEKGWERCEMALAAATKGASTQLDPRGLLTMTPEGIVSPRGMVRYYGLHMHLCRPVARGPRKPGKRRWMDLYGGKVTAHGVQHLERCIVGEAAVRILRETGHRFALLVHDELIYVTLEAEAEPFLKAALDITRRPPSFWPELPVWSEGGVGHNYGDAKHG